MSEDRRKTGRGATARAGWGLWLLWFVPLFIGGSVAVDRFGLGPVLLAMAGLLVAVLLHQRIVRRRGWRSILLGEPVSRG